jgi:hypothetical protein
MHRRFLLNIVVLCLCLGCGTGEYESRMGGHRAGSAAAAPDLLGPAEDLPGMRVSIHAPRGMTLLPEGADPKRARAFPLPVQAGQQRIYEGFVKDSEGGETPFYCYIIAMEMPKVPGLNLMEQMKNVAAKMPGAAPQLAEVPTASPEGRESKWQMARGPDKMEFYYKGKDGKETLRSMDMVGEMYLREEAGYFLMIAWRVPSHIEQNIGGDVGLAQLAKAVAGAVSIKPQ